MTRDDATKIARRIMDRIEQERTIHLDSMVDEIVAGMALIEPMGTKRVEPSPEYKRAMEQLELQRQMESVYRGYTSNNTGGGLYGQSFGQPAIYGVDCYGQQTSRIADPSIGLGGGILNNTFNPIRCGKIDSLDGVALRSGGSVTHHESDPISGYVTTHFAGIDPARPDSDSITMWMADPINGVQVRKIKASDFYK